MSYHEYKIHCAVGVPHEIFFLWQPFLRDPKDEMVLELAIKAGCESTITYNTRDFTDVEQFGLKLLKPSEFLCLTGKAAMSIVQGHKNVKMPSLIEVEGLRS
jgi:hypothetical protein